MGLVGRSFSRSVGFTLDLLRRFFLAVLKCFLFLMKGRRTDLERPLLPCVHHSIEPWEPHTFASSSRVIFTHGTEIEHRLIGSCLKGLLSDQGRPHDSLPR